MEKMNGKSKSGSSATIIDVHIRKKGFPAGMFLLLFSTLALAALGAIMVYTFYAGKGQIGIIESYTREYSIKLVNTFAGAAELGFRKGSGERLKKIFRNSGEKDAFEEAFFVLQDGTLVAHSIGDVEKELHGNIFNDEMAYNSELILKTSRDKSAGILFTDYNIIALRIPFNRMERKLLKEYLYGGIDTSGWLVSKAVFIKGNPAGSVNLIIGKDRIFRTISDLLSQGLRLLMVSAGAAFVISFLMALIIFIRYRRIQNDTLAQAEEKIGYRLEGGEALDEDLPIDEEFEKDVVLEDETIPSVEPFAKEESISVELFDEKKSGADNGAGRVIDLYSARKERTNRETEFPDFAERGKTPSREIKDAVPIVRRSNT